jgi:hypothetical protein
MQETLAAIFVLAIAGAAEARPARPELHPFMKFVPTGF